MPYPMTHLLIARELLSRVSCIPNAPQFYLGSLAPDGAHFLPGYTSDRKLHTHLCVIDGSPWGEITDNNAWQSNALSFLNDALVSGGCFAFGYAAHILADLYNNEHIWPSYRSQYLEDVRQGRGNRTHEESMAVDQYLYQTSPHTAAIMRSLTQSRAEALENAVTLQEVEGIRDNILNRQYKNKPPAETRGFVYMTPERALGFVQEAAGFVVNALRPYGFG